MARNIVGYKGYSLNIKYNISSEIGHPVSPSAPALDQLYVTSLQIILFISTIEF